MKEIDTYKTKIKEIKELILERIEHDSSKLESDLNLKE